MVSWSSLVVVLGLLHSRVSVSLGFFVAFIGCTGFPFVLE